MIVWIRKDVEAIDNDSSREMKTNVIEDDSVFRFGSDSERVLRIVTIDADGIRATGNMLDRGSPSSAIDRARVRVKSNPPHFASRTGFSIVAILRNDRVATANVTSATRHDYMGRVVTDHRQSDRSRQARCT